MSDESTISSSRVTPFQFRLKQAAVWTLVLGVLLAFIFQWGLWGVLGFLVVVAIGILCYGTYWGEWKLAAVAAGILLLAPCIVSLPEEGERVGPRRMRCEHKLKQIGMALHNYHDTYGCLPPPYAADASGKPTHSWRVLLLPFMEYRDLYQRYDMREPWNGPNNIKLAAEIPDVYRCADLPRGATTDTAFVAIAGPETMWPQNSSVALAGIKDGARNTLCVVECPSLHVNWLEPRDLRLQELPTATIPQRGHGIISQHQVERSGRRGTWGLFADGSVRFLPTDLSGETLRGLATIAGGEKASPSD